MPFCRPKIGQNRNLAQASSTIRRPFLISGATLKGQVKIAEKAICPRRKQAKLAGAPIVCEPLRTLMEEQPLTLQVLLQPRAHGLEVVGDAAFQAAGSHTGGLHVGGHAFGRGRQGLGVHQQALLARVEAPVGGKQNVEVAGQPSRGG